MLWWRARSSSRMWRRISATREKKPWKRCDWLSSRSSRGPPMLANISANLCSRVSRSTSRRMACSVLASTGKPRSTTEHLSFITTKQCHKILNNKHVDPHCWAEMYAGHTTLPSGESQWTCRHDRQTDDWMLDRYITPSTIRGQHNNTNVDRYTTTSTARDHQDHLLNVDLAPAGQWPSS